MKHRIIPFILTAMAALALCLGIFASTAEAKTYDYEIPAITALENTAEGITLEWEARPGSAYYAVLRKTNGATWVRQAIVTDTHWTDTKISSGNTYTYNVRCMDKDKLYISPSDTGKDILCLCTRKAYTTLVSTGVKVTWSTAKGAEGYNIFRQEKGVGSPEMIGYAEGQATTAYIDRTVENAHTYVYYVVPVTSSVSAAIDPSKGGERKWNTAPAAPAITWDGATAHITWQAVEGTDKYAVYRKINGGSWSKKATLTADVTTWADEAGKITGNEYTYAVRCLASNGNISSVRSAPSKSVYVITPVIKSTQNRAEGVVMTISANKSVEMFNIYRAEKGGEEALLATFRNSDKVSKITFTDTQVTDKTRYIYRAEVTCNGGSSSSLPVEVKYTSPTKPAYVKAPFITLHTSPESSPEGAAVTESLLYRDEILFIDKVSSSKAGYWAKVQIGEEYRYIWQGADEEDKLSFEPLPDLGLADYQTPWQQDAVNKALEVLAQPTAYAHEKSTGTADEDGYYRYDCSGLASYILDSAMHTYVPVYDCSANIITMFKEGVSYNAGLPNEFHSYTITKDELQPGDLIFFELQDEGGMADLEGEEAGSLPSHVGMYIGNGEFIHCTHYSWGANGVFVMPYAGYYEDHTFELRRYMPASADPANAVAYAASSTVNIRDAANMDGDVIASIPGTTPVTILYAGSSWSQIKAPGKTGEVTGFVLNKYLTSELEYGEGTDMVISAVRKTIYNVPQTALATYSYQLIAGTEVKYRGYFYNSSYAVLEVNGNIVFAYAPNGTDSFLAESIGETYTEGTLTAASYLRSSPASASDENKIRLVKKDETLKIFSQDASWAYVETAAGERGFVATKNIAAD